MCALVPPPFPTFGWPRSDSFVHHYNYNPDTIEAVLHHSPPPTEQQQQQRPQAKVDRSVSSSENSGDPAIVQKLNHNASERDRRRKMNSLYLSLRALLPVTDETKKLSIPATVSQVLKYVPELQKQVERLARKKERLLTKLSSQGDVIHQENQRKSYLGSSLSPISVNRLNDNEIVVQISTNNKADKGSLSEILLCLEDDGLVLINASSFESFGGGVFYNLHLQVERSYKLEYDVLTERLLTVYEKRDDWFI